MSLRIVVDMNLSAGALPVVAPAKSRVRVLPL